MTITSTMRKMMLDISAEDKQKMRAAIEQNAGSPYHRTILALIVDLEDALEEALYYQQQRGHKHAHR